MNNIGSSESTDINLSLSSPSFVQEIICEVFLGGTLQEFLGIFAGNAVLSPAAGSQADEDRPLQLPGSPQVCVVL